MKGLKITRQKETLAPGNATIVGRSGTCGNQAIIPPDKVLCVQCWSALDHHLYQHHRALYKRMEEQSSALHGLAREWIADKHHPPRPRPLTKRFSSSVPQWMRSAIDAGMVKTNSEEKYVVYNQRQIAIRVEVVD
jgi:hypothetical protein